MSRVESPLSHIQKRVAAILQVTGCWAFGVLAGLNSPASAAEPSARELLSANAMVVLEVRQPQAVFQHALVMRAVSILNNSRAYQDAVGNPDYDLLRDSINHFESQFGAPILQILDGCLGEGVWASGGGETLNEFCVVGAGRDPAKVAKLPEVTLSLIRRIVAGRGVNLPDPAPRTYQQHTYYQLGDGFYAVAGSRWLLANREALLHGMLDRLDGRQPATTTGVPALLTGPSADGTAIRLAVDLVRLQQQPGYPAQFKWPPKEIGSVILAAGWLDLARRSPHAIAEINLGGDAVRASVRFPSTSVDITAGTLGYFASEPQAAAAPLLEPARLIYSASWYRDYAKMWEKRSDVPLPAEVKNLEAQLAKTEDGVLGYSAFDILRLIGPHLRFVATRPGTSPYRVPVIDRLPNFALVLDVRDEQEFREKVLPPIQKILGIVAITNKMIPQNVPYKTAEVSAMKFAEDTASVMNSDRVRYNFEPTYTVTRGHLIVGSTAGIVRNLIDDLDRLKTVSVQQLPSEPGMTERQIVRFEELAGIVDDLHGLSVRNAVLNDGLTIAEAEHELGILQQLVSTLGQLQVEAGFTPQGFEYRIHLQPTGK